MAYGGGGRGGDGDGGGGQGEEGGVGLSQSSIPCPGHSFHPSLVLADETAINNDWEGRRRRIEQNVDCPKGY